MVPVVLLVLRQAMRRGGEDYREREIARVLERKTNICIMFPQGV